LTSDGAALTMLASIPDSGEKERAEVTSDKAIFLSHAHVERALADLLRNTLVLGGVPERHIFYSSSRATGIPSGEGIRPYLQRSLQQAGLVIELVSETFLRSSWCLMELGGAWALGTSTYPVVVPPLTRDLVVQQIGDVQMGILGAESDLDDLFDELHDRVAKDVGIQAQTTLWNRAIRDFKRQLSPQLAATPTAAKSADEADQEILNASLPRIIMPSLLGHTRSDVAAALAGMPLYLDASPVIASDNWIAVSQDPQPNQPTPIGSGVQIVFAGTVPHLNMMTRRAAEAILKELNLVLAAEPSDAAVGSIAQGDQTPAAGSPPPFNRTVAVSFQLP
jgi:hypothetical protein